MISRAALCFTFALLLSGQDNSFAHVRSLIDARHLDQAENIAVRHLAVDSHDVTWILLLAEIRLDQRRYSESLQLLQNAKDLGEPSEQLALLTGLNYVALRRNDLAEPELRVAVAANPSNPMPAYYLGRLLYAKNVFDESIHFTELALKLNPGLIRAYENLGLCYQAKSMYAEARQQYLTGIELQRASHQKIEWPALDLGTMLLSQEHAAEAETYLREAVQINPDSADAHFHLGTALQAEQKFETAQQEYQQAIALNPALSAAHYRLAALYRRLGQTEAANKELDEFQRLKK